MPEEMFTTGGLESSVPGVYGMYVGLILDLIHHRQV
jgi:hypothetical protein